MVGVHSGTTTVVDQGGPSCMTLPGFRKFVAEPATTRVYAFLSAYLVGGLEGHYYPALYGPDGVDVPATIRAARENADLVRGIKAHAEIGGVARWGLEVLRLGAEIAREADLPLYVHFGQLWPLPKSGGGRRRPGLDPPAGGRDPSPRGRSRASLHSPSRRLRRPGGPRAPGRPRGARARPPHRRGARLPLQLRRGAPRAGRGDRPRHARRRSPRLQHRGPAAGGHAARGPPRSRAPSLRREHALQPGPRDDGAHRVRAHAGAGGADGDPERRADARPRGRAGHAPPRHRRRRHRARRPARAASPSGTTAAPRRSPSAC